MNRYAMMALAACLLIAGDAPKSVFPRLAKERPPGDMKALEGCWFGGAWTCNGAWALVVNLENPVCVLEFADGVALLRWHTGRAERWSYTLNETRVPKTIDLTVIDGPDKGKVRQGIYEIRPSLYGGGYYLYLCIAEAGVSRPGEFVWDTDWRRRPWPSIAEPGTDRPSESAHKPEGRWELHSFARYPGLR
jgi:uncharacterized protein (TIGR03067 family)